MRTTSRPRLVALGAIGLAFATAAAAPAIAQTDNPAPAVSQSAMPQSFAPLVNKVKPAVVNISTTQLESSADRRQLPQAPDFPPGSPFGQFFHQFGPPQSDGQQFAQPLTALGSGFIIDPSGYVVTNNHVVHNGTNIEVTLQDGTTLKAKLVGHDDLTDLALLKVSADRPLPYVAFGDSDALQVGDWVVSVGNPFGLGGSVTSGILSARSRNIHEGPYDDFLQIDAPINQGNSGGPTFNELGQVVGINTAIFSPNGGGSVGIGFAIPANLAKPVVAELEKSGTVVRGWLGVAVQGIQPPMEDALGVKSTDGALVASVNPDSPAAQAGLKPGDVIVHYADQPVKRVRDLTWAVANTPPGKSVELAFLRNGQEVSHAVTISRLQPKGGETLAQDSPQPPRLGLELRAITPETRQEYDLPKGSEGVLVVGVAPGSPGDRAGIQPGDVIEQVSHGSVHTPRQVVDAVRAAGDHGKKSVALGVNRNGQQQFVALELPSANQS